MIPFIEYLIDEGCSRGVWQNKIVKDVHIDEEKRKKAWNLPHKDVVRLFGEIDTHWRTKDIGSLRYEYENNYLAFSLCTQ
jgi:hypothetical protein